MKIAARCEKCLLGRALVHTTIQHARYIVRYRKCNVCHDHTKTIQMLLTRNDNIERNVGGCNDDAKEIDYDTTRKIDSSIGNTTWSEDTSQSSGS